MSCYLRGTHESELDLAKPKHLIWVRARFKQSLRNFQGWSCYHVVKLGVLFQQAARKGGEWLIWDSNGDTLQRIQTWNVTVITVCVCLCLIPRPSRFNVVFRVRWHSIRKFDAATFGWFKFRRVWTEHRAPKMPPYVLFDGSAHHPRKNCPLASVHL